MENAPYGAFHRKCEDLGIHLFFGSSDSTLGLYEVAISYRYRGRGTAYVTVEAFSEEDAEKLALEKFDETDIDTYDAEVDDCEVESITRSELPSKG